jgi:hypothetical protein
VVSGEWRWRGGGLTCLRGFRVPQTMMTVSSSSLPSFTAGVCGDGEQGTWEWSVMSGDTGWRAYLPAGLSCAPNDDNSVVVVTFAVLYSRCVGMESRRLGGGLW